VAIRKVGDVLVQQLVEHAPLIVRDDAIADLHHHDLVTVGQHALERENAEGADRDQDQGTEIFVDIGLVDDGAEHIGRYCRAGGGTPHQDEGKDVAAPVLVGMLGEQPADQRWRTMRIGEQGLEALCDHAVRLYDSGGA